MNSYEAVIKYDIYQAILIKGEIQNNFESLDEMLQFYNNDPAKTPNNPLLNNYEWVYKHVEKIFCNNKLDYQKYQGFEQYYTFFKALINKYSLAEDYEKYIQNDNVNKIKWSVFAINLIDFLNHAFDERLKKLLDKDDVIGYFLKYSKIYTPKIISNFSEIGLEKFLQYDYYASYYVENYDELIGLIRKNLKISIPKNIILNENFIQNVSRTHQIENFYFKLHFIREQVCDLPFLEEHKKYCDYQVKNIKDNILPCYRERYDKSVNTIPYENIDILFNSMESQVVKRIFKLKENNELSKKYVYQELSKYTIIGMYMSRNYQTDPYNLLIDIETLYEFAINNNRKLKGQKIYEFLISFESKTINEIINMYNFSKELPIMEILYDDWNNQKDSFIKELNSKTFNISNLLPISINGVTCYDISDISNPIIVHNTSIPIDDLEKIEDMVNKIKKGLKYRVCLSVQDNNHTTFYDEKEKKDKRTIKLAYGALDSNRVGIIYHTDSYSLFGDKVEPENFSFTRKLYTVESLLKCTNTYNEIVYIINGLPFLPIGIICEYDVTECDIKVANMLNIPILYRKKRESVIETIDEVNLGKQYSYVADKRLF